MDKLKYALILVIVACIIGGFELDYNNQPIEKQARFIDQIDPNSNTYTVLESEYTGDLSNLPSGAKKKVGVRINAATGDVVKQRFVVLRR